VAGLLPARNGERDLLELRATERDRKFHRRRSGPRVVQSDLAGTRWSETRRRRKRPTVVGAERAA
jgi:hypothetical protein